MRRVIFALAADVEVLDLAGPVQAFGEANHCGGEYQIHVCALTSRLRTDQGIWLSDLEPLPETTAEDLVVIPGYRMTAVAAAEASLRKWLQQAHESGAHLASVCTGAFPLGAAGLLDSRQCTTHWSRVDDLQRRFPRAKVLTNRLFVDDGPVTTSAGIASGIDMALSLIERHYGPRVTAATARELVVYLRRDGAHQQHSVYLDYRTHLHPGVHRVQDWLIANPAERATLEDLGDLAALSPRHLTRTFREATGISIQDYRTRLRLELARDLLHDPGLTLEAIATRCGFESARQLRRVWKEAFGTPPSAGR